MAFDRRGLVSTAVFPILSLRISLTPFTCVLYRNFTYFKNMNDSINKLPTPVGVGSYALRSLKIDSTGDYYCESRSQPITRFCAGQH